jgi:alpha-amylase/alpha-mannosidase (GH57 family)
MKYICIHGHFYQPPRENAWLEQIEVQESAKPWHDWNERITDECYGPNAVSRILNDNGHIIDIRNNYAKLSFNFGPTLLSWMESKRPGIYQAILEADKQSRTHFGGHGSALAQVYNHIIMPLANRRDKETQVVWGLLDFERRFGRRAEGMWLAETAVDTETLEVLAENNLQFTILAPRQAKRFRKIGSKTWEDGIDTRRPYLCRLPSGRSIYLYFYDGDRSQRVAFGGLLDDGRRFAESLLSGFSAPLDEPQLVHIATDGESYGHHHRNGDMALAYCMNYIEAQAGVRLTNYGEFLSLAPVEYEAEIVEDSSWSCVHGVERWRNDCGCNTGGRPDWNQKWRAPLREALDWLRDQFAALYEKEMAPFHIDCWDLRNEYILVPLKRSIQRAEAFMRAHVPGEWSDRQKTLILALLEIQRQSLYMFTSCGWFFDEISGLEPVQVLQYANRGIQLAEVYFGVELEAHFSALLALAPSNMPTFANAQEVYQQYVQPARLNLTQVGMHYALRSIFSDDSEKQEVLNYECNSEEFERYNAGAHRLVLGVTRVRSKITRSEETFSFVILYLGQHHIIGHTFDQWATDQYRSFGEQLKKAFDRSNLSAVIELLHTIPNQKTFSFFDMFKDEQFHLLNGMLREELFQASMSYHKINDRNYNLMNVMRASGLAVPEMLLRNLEQVLNADLETLFEDSDRRISIRKLKARMQELEKWAIKIDMEKFRYKAGIRLRRLAESIPSRSNSEEALVNIRQVLEVIRPLGIDPDIAKVQEIIFQRLLQLNGDDRGTAFNKALKELGKHIQLDVDGILARRTKVKLVV